MEDNSERASDVTANSEKRKNGGKMLSVDSMAETKFEENNIVANNNNNNAPSTTGNIQKRPQRRGVKEKPDHPERALFCLGLKNPLRSLCISIVDSK